MAPKAERRVVTTFRLPESDKIKIENVLAEQGETWQSYLEPLAYKALGKQVKLHSTKEKAMVENNKAAIELLQHAIKKLQNPSSNSGYRGKRL